MNISAGPNRFFKRCPHIRRLALIVPFITLSQAGEIIRVAEFRGNRAGAVSYTFDDGMREQFTLAQPLFDALGYRSTFFIIPGTVSADLKEAAGKKPGSWGTCTWDDIRAAAAKGHEIANHSWSHPNLTKLDAPALAAEIEKAREKIKRETGAYPRTFCYPYNSSNTEVRAAAMLHHESVREFQTGIGKNDLTPARINAWTDQLAADHQWGVAMIHGITVGFDAIDPGLLRDHLTHLEKHRQDLWVDTFGNVAGYVKTRESTKLTTTGSTPESITFQLLADPPQAGWVSPLTVVVTAKDASSPIARTSSGTLLPVKREMDHFLFDCLPGKETVTLTWKKTN